MGDGGWRRIDATASRHFLTLLSTRASGAPLAPPTLLRSRLVEGCVSAARSREAR